jgi:hypothetical protein
VKGYAQGHGGGGFQAEHAFAERAKREACGAQRGAVGRAPTALRTEGEDEVRRG